jgi:hypothetical protein
MGRRKLPAVHWIATYVALVERSEFLAKSMNELQTKYLKLSEKQGAEFNRMFGEYEERTFERNKLGNLIGIRLDVPSEKRRRLFPSKTLRSKLRAC